jgi:hypothetical protein
MVRAARETFAGGEGFLVGGRGGWMSAGERVVLGRVGDLAGSLVLD